MPRRKRKSSRRRRANAKAREVAGHSHTDAGPDRIVCLHCGNEYRVISAHHLRAKHGYEGPHPVREYKERFGLRIAVCEEVRERASEVQFEYHTREGRHHTADEIIAYIRERSAGGEPLARARVPGWLADQASRRFGTWDDALRAAGEDPLDHRLLGGWTRDDILDRIRQVAAEVPMSDRRAFREHQKLYGQAMNEFGAWSRALKAAGLDPAEHRDERYWTIEEAEGWVRERHAEGESFRSRDAPNGAAPFIARKTGMTWVEFVESLGIEYPEYARRKPWTNAEVIRKIRARRRAGEAMFRQAVEDAGLGALVRQAITRFGSWDAALEAAGMDPMAVRQKRPWTRDAVVEAIQERHRQGLSLVQERVVEDDRRIVVAAGKLWPKPRPWLRAIRAAGLDPSLAKGRKNARQGRST